MKHDPLLKMYYRNYFTPILASIVAISMAFLRPKQQLHAKMVVPGRNNTVLFISNSEHGNSNVFLATAHALLLEHGEIDVHFATFKKRADDIASINRFTSLNATGAGSLTFHEITSAPSYSECLSNQNFTVGNAIHAPGLRGSSKFCHDMETYLSK
jgi:hypothetical protein